MKQEKAVLIHGYLTDREGKDKPDRLTRIGILSAAELYRHKKVDKICFAAIESLSNNQVKRLKILLANPTGENVVVYPEAVTTREEVTTFKKMSEDNEWSDLATIGNRVHIPRIKKEIRKAFGDMPVDIITPEGVLSQYPRYSSILDEMDTWPEQRSLALQEKLLDTPLGSLALKVAPLVSRFKVSLQYRFFSHFEN